MFKTTPFKYQEKGIYFSYNSCIQHGYAALLVEMGLGKSLMSLYCMELLQRSDKIDGVFIVSPKSLISTWKAEIEKHTYQDPEEFKIWSNQKPLEQADHCFVNVEIFQRSNKVLKSFLAENLKNKILILDESTRIKNPKAQRTKNVLSYTKDAKYKIILTGTEITTSLLDLYTQYEFLKEWFWGMPNFWGFRSKYANLELVRIPGHKPFKKVIGFKRIGELTSRISHCTFRAKKKDHLDLPEKIFQDIKLDMTPKQRKIYQELKQNLVAEYQDKVLTVTNKVALFIRFRQITGGFMPESNDFLGSPKFDFIKADTEDYEDKVIIWCCFTPEINYLVEKLPGAVKYDGKISQKEKDYNIREFQHNNEIKYFIANPASAAFGLNLQFCSLVYNYSRTLSPELDAQSQDRTHRIGMSGHCTYKNLMCVNTVDERIQQILNNRQDMRESFQDMSIEDIYKLI